MTGHSWRLLVASPLLAATTWQQAHAQFLLGTPRPLGPDVNSSVRDSAPNLSSDGLTLYFSSRRAGGIGTQSLWQVTRASTLDPWDSPTNLTSIGGVFATNPSISPDGLELYFADGWNNGVGSPRPSGLGRSDIWVSKRPTIHDEWGEPDNLGQAINSSSAEDGPFISSDGLSLYFASDRLGGHGGNDLYVATRQAIDAPWESPVNLGAGVNASGDEWMGGLSPDQRTLFFDSQRPGSHNLGDMYLATRRGADAPFANPVHFPPPLNASSGSWKMVMSPDESALLYTVGHGNTAVDIWEVPLMPFEGVDIGNGSSYFEDFDDPLGIDGSAQVTLPAGWTASDRDAVFHTNITNTPFPSPRASGLGPHLLNAGADQDADRSLAVYAPFRSNDPMLQLLAEAGEAGASAIQLAFDVEAWDNLRPIGVPGEAAFDVTVDIDTGDGFEALADLGTITTGAVLSLPEGEILDGNLAANRISFDSGVLPVDIPAGAQLRFRWTVPSDTDAAGWVYGLDNVKINLLAAAAPLAGDYNGNGTVEQADLDLVLLNWGKDGAVPPTGWTNDLPSGAIDQSELDGVLLGWGKSTAAAGLAAAVPEPNTAAMALILLLLGTGKRLFPGSSARWLAASKGHTSRFGQ